jgi:tetratricopeptide (TPR) repeat protein
MPDLGATSIQVRDSEREQDLARTRRAKGDLAGALAIYSSLRAQQADLVAAYLGEAQVLSEMGRAEEAEPILIEAVARFPQELGPVIERARLAQQRGNLAESARRWTIVRTRAPHHVAGYTGSAAVHREQGRPDLAEALLRQATERFPDDPGVAIDYAWIAQRCGAWAEALGRWDAVAERFPQYSTGKTQGAVALRELHRYDEAEVRLREAMRQWPHERGPMVEYAWIPCARRDWPQALDRWEQVRDRFPETPESHLRVAMVLVDLWRFDDAERAFQAGMARFPDDSQFAIEHARLAFRHNKYDEALRHFTYVRERFPNEEAGWIGGAQTLRHQFKLAEADLLLEDALGRFPSKPAVLIEYIRVPIAPVVKAERDWNVALARLRLLRDRFPGFVPGLLTAIQILCEGEQLEEAEAWASEAIRRLPNDLPLAVAHARVARERGDWVEALHRFEQVNERFPGNPDAIAGLGAALTGVGRLDEADRLLGDALSRFSYHPDLFAEYARVAVRREDWSAALTRWTDAHRCFPDEARFAHRVFEMQLRLADQGTPQTDAGYQPPVAAASAQPTALANEERRRIRDTLLHFESLGGRGLGCEFGIFQRDYGAEPLGLLRWADMPPDKLVEVLVSRFAGVGEPDNTVMFVDREHGRPEYCTQDKRGMMFMRTFVFEEDEPSDRMWSQALRRLKFLADKLICDLEAAEKIFVYRITSRNLSEAEVDAIWRAVRSYGDNTLLYVRYEDAAHPNGMVEVVKPGLMIGYMDRFKQLPNGELTAAPANASWAEVCRRAHDLWVSGVTKAGVAGAMLQATQDAWKTPPDDATLRGGVAAPPAAVTCARLAFGAGGNADGHLGRGWSAGEDGFRWMIDDASEFWMDVLDVGPHTLTLDLHPHVGQIKCPVQRVSILVGGKVLHRSELTAPIVCNIAVAPAVGRPSARLEIVIEHPDAISPRALSGSNDDRTLALAIREARLSPSARE